MEDKLLIALIAAGSALVGSLIPQIFSYFNNRAQRVYENDKSLQDLQASAYIDLLINLQHTMNKGDEAFPELQKSILQVALHGDKKTASEVEKYYRALVHRGSELQKEDHALYQKNILNSMRERRSLDPLDSFEVVRFGPVPSTNKEGITRP